jgi:hypothetical protein
MVAFGCFAGLISIVANDISKLEKCYHFYEYDFEMWENALNNFLECSFVEWAKDNPNIWNNKFGFHIFIKNKAWGKKENETLTHNYLDGVCNGHILCLILLYLVFHN